MSCPTRVATKAPSDNGPSRYEVCFPSAAQRNGTAEAIFQARWTCYTHACFQALSRQAGCLQAAKLEPATLAVWRMYVKVTRLCVLRCHSAWLAQMLLEEPSRDQPAAGKGPARRPQQPGPANNPG